VGEAFPRLVVAARHVASVVIAGVVAALFWMFILAEGHTGQILGANWTEHNFSGGLGHALGSEEARRFGVYPTLILGVLAALVFALVERRLPGRGWTKGLTLAAGLFLLWGLVFTPLVDSREPVRDEFLPTGLFGMDAGWGTILSGAAASLAAGIIIARLVPMIRDPAWWQGSPQTPEDAALRDEVFAHSYAPLFELPEKGAEQGKERPG
jgi:hypothetical protein